MKSYAIANLDGVPAPEFFVRIERLVRAGVDSIQLRAKPLDDRLLVEVAQRCRSLIPPGATRFIINGRPDIALASRADGVHLPAEGLPARAVRAVGEGLILGRSCHTLEACREAEEEEVESIVFGPVFDARSKESPARVTKHDLVEASKLGAEIYALGGIARENLETLRGLPIAGIAAVTLFMADEPLEEIVESVRAL
ncbi:MAG TPA: thiamine phosphate synthase [Thermoanaerobaculia bacterium]